MTTEEFTARYMPQFSEQQKTAVRETEEIGRASCRERV